MELVFLGFELEFSINLPFPSNGNRSCRKLTFQNSKFQYLGIDLSIEINYHVKMVKRNYSIDVVLHALSDPTRRQVIERLGNGPRSVSDLALPFSMAMPSFMQHLDILESSQLIYTEKVGRVRICYLNQNPFSVMENWLQVQKSQWETRLNQLDSFLLKTRGKI
ncbi:ArsR/SmtB family transcription factor [Leptospira meyeri]|uniref:ArsR/SmtB family transcription factor n=1 Tax=Leptospira meyeri TaxID=29508 RepID=UPI001E373E1A|nr:metalloregulator ArsR/SmtB family transcription factor [Leptospira meyeri]